jgi:hypothetical protein
VEEFDQRWPESYKYQREQREHNQRDDHLGGSLGRRLFGATATLGA